MATPVNPVFVRENVKVTALAHVRHLDLQAVRVDDAGLWLNGELALLRAEIASVSVSLHDRTTVHMRSPSPKGFSCTFTDNADADALLAALGRTRERTMIEIALEPSLSTDGFDDLPWWKAFVVTTAALVAWLLLMPFVARPTGSTGGGISRLLDRTLELGADGVRLRGRFTNAFVTYRDIESVTQNEGLVTLMLRNGRRSVLALTAEARGPDVVRHIERAMAEATAPADADIATLLREVPGTKADKVAALRALGTETNASYRDVRLPRERLWGIVEDPQVSGATRARAAVALSGELPPEDRERLRIAADATVSPKVRIAMDAVAHANDEMLGEHLDALPEDEEQIRAGSRRSRESQSPS